MILPKLLPLRNLEVGPLRGICILLLMIAFSWGSGVARADQVNPARLELRESEPGTFSVLFALPVTQGKKIRARAFLPSGCIEIGEREERWTSVSWEASWVVRCDPSSLAGEAIRLEGLIGTPIDVMLEIETVEGRLYRETLKPSRATYVVPLPPGLTELVARAARVGSRRALRSPELYLLLLVVALGIPGWRLQWFGIALFALAHAAGQGGAEALWIEVSPLVATSWIALITAIAAVGELADPSPDRRSLGLGWWAVLSSGALLGAAHPETVASLGLSSAEQRITFLAFALGIAVSLLLIAGIVAQIQGLSAKAWGEARARRRLASIAGGLACGLALYYGLPTLAGVLRPEETGLLLVAILLGLAVGPWWSGRIALSGLAMALMALGTLPGIARLPLPLGSTVPIACLVLLGVVQVLGSRLSARVAIATTLVAAPISVWFVAHVLANEVSRAPAHIAGMVLLAMAALFLGARRQAGSTLELRILGAIAVIGACLYRLAEYREWVGATVATEAALGRLRIPVLSLLLLVFALLVWPRSRAALKSLGVEGPRSSKHWVALAAAFLLVPHGTLGLPNPFFEPHAPAANEARLVLTRVLSDSYQAFNLKDEDALYDRLSESVSGELVADLYLDSRRRLTAGTREGSKVTVEDVKVLEVGDATESADGFSYPCKWVVTARVQHLVHVHHRQNIYQGFLTLRVEDDRWKIAAVELTSEDRVVVSWKSN